MLPDPSQIEATARRYQERLQNRARNERLIREGNYLRADSPERVEMFLARRTIPTPGAEVLFPVTVPDRAAPVTRVAGPPDPEALERVLGTNDLIGVAFLEQGLQVARTVGRIWVGVTGGRVLGYGTGFLISPRLLLTNNHVLKDQAIAQKSIVEFDYQIGLSGAVSATTTFGLQPDLFFVTDRHFDFSVVAVQSSGTGNRSLTAFGWTPLIEEEGKVIISQWMNIIQHPNGEPKQLSLRENQLVDVLDDFLQYKTDTAPGSSGSPVFNDRWEVVGLHHSGVWATNAAGQILAVDGSVWTEGMGEHRIKWIANEGVRISKLLAHLCKQPMSQEQRRLFDEIFTTPRPPVEARSQPSSAASSAAFADTRAIVDSDGSATWTIPLSVSIRLGAVTSAAPPVAATTPPAMPGVPDRTLPSQPTVSGPVSAVPSYDLDAIVESARRELGSRADVLDVELGYVFKNGWITNDRALVITVRQKMTPAALREARVSPLPETFFGLPVEVINPSIEDLVRLARGPAVEEAAFEGATILPEEITYVPPDDAPLDQVSAPMRVVAHVSPDAGWPQLSRFLEETRKQLVIGMYDFGAPHIVEAVAALSRKNTFRKLTLVMQKGESVGEGTKEDDLKDTEVVDRLREALNGRFENTWIKIGSVNGWVSSSYHIKVAVRDQKAFWLSSGNWQSSNQPEANPLSEDPPQRSWLSRYNREWHAIVEHAGLAKTFETYLLHDFANNLDVEAREALNLPDVLVPESFFIPTAEERAAEFQYFQPFEANRPFTVTPLLTPDNYHQQVLDLVKGASEELLIQNQTFNPPKEDQEKLRELIEAVRERHEAGVKVRVIFRLMFPKKAREVLSGLKDHGIPDSIIQVQRNMHTKGIVVDRKRVLLGSQNWSNDGVSVNRDASLLFEDEDLARYFAAIFEHDWDHLAKPDIGSESMPIEVAAADQPTPPGMVRLSWKDYMEML
jgi:V8-like Glu-specific endopeptidase